MTATKVPVLEQACAALVGVGAAKVERTADGPRTVVYRVVLADGRRAVVKLFAAGVSHTAAHEARVLDALAESTVVKVPEVIAHGPVPTYPATALITVDVGTRTLGGEVSCGRMARSTALSRLGRLLNAVHSVRPPSGTLLAPALPGQVNALAKHCPAPVLTRLTPVIETVAQAATGRRSVWCHGDLHFDNVIPWGDGHASECLVDFEGTTWAVPEYDLAQTLVTCDALDTRDLRTLTAAYGRPVHLPLLHAHIVFQALRGWTYAAHLEGRDRTRWASRLDRALAIARLTQRTLS